MKSLLPHKILLSFLFAFSFLGALVQEGQAQSEFLQASNGDFVSKVSIVWNLPSLANGATEFRIHRSLNPIGCTSLLASGISPSATSFEDLQSVVPGTVYFYSLEALNAGTFLGCSQFDSGYARVSPPVQVSATDGTYPDKVVITWQPPILGGQITGYAVYRGQSCNQLLQTNIPSTTLLFEDTSAVPGTIYPYSLRTLSPSGSSDCSLFDPGHARIGPPQNVSATDGTFPDKVVVTWQPPSIPGSISAYELYRGPNCDSLIQSNIPVGTLTYNDFNVIPGTHYEYSLMTVSAAGKSVCSAHDPGYAITACSNGIDDDGDGLADYPEDPGCTSLLDNSELQAGHICDDGLDNDSDGKTDYKANGSGDPGCENPQGETEENGDSAIASPAFAKFNTYLGQWNFAELVNQGTTGKVIGLTVYNLRGQVMIQRSVYVAPGNEVDIDVNSLILFACNVLNSNCDGFEDRSATVGAPNGANAPDGIVDTYGFLRFDYDDSNAKDRIFGRVSFYRPNKEGSYSFAFAREFKNRLSGDSFAMSNTYDPKGGNDLTPNWVEVINFGTKGPNGTHNFIDQTYTVNVYKQNGELKESRSVTLPPLGEYDVHGGHEYLNSAGKVEQGVYLVEVLPNNPDAEYFLSVARYSSNSPAGVDPETYNFALVLDGRIGSTDGLFAPTANVMEGIAGLSIFPTVDNWVETGCASNSPCNVTVTYRDASGVIISQGGTRIPPKGQFHFNASAVFAGKGTGSVELHSDQPIIAQSMSYLHGNGGALLSGFASLAKGKQRATQIGTMNTFLGMENQLALVSSSNLPSVSSYKVVTFGGDTSTGNISLSAGAASLLGISSNPTIQFPADRYGTIELQSGSDGVAVGEVRRIRVFGGEIDFVMPTAIR